MKARGFGDADDIASVLRRRVATSTEHPAATRGNPHTPGLIAGLIPGALGITEPDMRDALAERHQLIEQKAGALVEHATAEGTSWVEALGALPADPREGEAWA